MAKTPEKTPEKKEAKKPLWDLQVKKAIAASAIITTLLSAGATVEANRPERSLRDKPIDISAELPDGHEVGMGVSVGMHEIVPRNETFRLPGIDATFMYRGDDVETTRQITSEPAPVEMIEESMSIETDVQLMEWARRFELDPHSADPRGPNAIKSTVEQIVQAKSEGYEMTGFKILGSASDEDRSSKNAGLGTDSKENKKLATKRSETVKNISLELLEKALGPDETKKIEDLIVVEDSIETRDDNLNDRIKKMAESLDMSTSELVKELNRHPESLPDSAQELGEELASGRFVAMKIEFSREVAAEQDIEPIVTSETITEKGEEKRAIIVIVPIFIPILKRRDEPETTITPPREKFEHAPRTIGKSRSGHQQVPQHIFQPDTGNSHYGKGSGGRISAERGTSHRGSKRH